MSRVGIRTAGCAQHEQAREDEPDAGRQWYGGDAGALEPEFVVGDTAELPAHVWGLTQGPF